MTSKIGFSVNVEHDLTFAYDADLVVFCPLLGRGGATSIRSCSTSPVTRWHATPG